MRARDIMTPDPTTIAPGQSVARAARLMRDLDVGAIPVVEDDRPVGILTDRDVAIRHVAESHDWGCPVADHMTADDLVTVEPDTSVETIAGRMKDARVRRVLVVEPNGRLAGIVAQADVVRHLGRKPATVVEDVLERISEPQFLPAAL